MNTPFISKVYNNFSFLHVQTKMQPEVVISGEPTNLGDGDGMQVPCFLGITSKKDCVGI